MAQILTTTLGHQQLIEKMLHAQKAERFFPVQVFVGPSGIGKRRVALGLVQNLLCHSHPACGECPGCRKIASQTSEALLVVKPSGTQIKVEDIGQVHQFVHLKLLTKARAVIIEDAHLLNSHAANSLLKLLEEPPTSTYFFLITQQVSDVLPTIRSRSQIVRFSPLSDTDLRSLREAPSWMYAAAQGSLESLENLLSPEITGIRQKALQLLTQNPASCFVSFQMISELKETRDTSLLVARFFQQFLRDALTLRAGSTSLIHADQEPALTRLAEMESDFLHGLLQKAFDMERGIAQNVERGLLMEDFWISSQGLVG